MASNLLNNQQTAIQILGNSSRDFNGQGRFRLKKRLDIILFALVALFSLAAAPNASASSITFILTDGSHCSGTCAPGPFGTITVSSVNANTVDVLASLNPGNRFVDTGGGHEALTWDILGHPAITIGPLPEGFEIGPVNDGVPGMGSFYYSIDCPGCGPGASHAKGGSLEFTITVAGGLTPEMFIRTAAAIPLPPTSLPVTVTPAASAVSAVSTPLS